MRIEAEEQSRQLHPGVTAANRQSPGTLCYGFKPMTDHLISRRTAALALLLGPAIAAGSGAGAPLAELFGVEIQGSGPDVLLLPGLASSPEVWAGLAAQLAPRHRVHLIDVAGFAGRPPVPNAAPLAANLAHALADYMGRNALTSSAVVGHSFGGEVALMLAARHRQAVGRLVVVDALPFYSLLFDPAATEQSAAPGAHAMRAAFLAATEQQLIAIQEAGAARLATGAESRAAISRWGRQSDLRTVAEAAYELSTTDLRPELPLIKAPTTVIYAYHPSYGPAEQVDAAFAAAYRGLGQARLVRIDDSRHFVMLDQPEAFHAAVGEALR